MNAIIYDLIAGTLVLLGIFALMPLITANQHNLRVSAQKDTEVERVDNVDEDKVRGKVNYYGSDVLGFLNDNTNQNGVLDDGIHVRINKYSGYNEADYKDTNGGNLKILKEYIINNSYYTKVFIVEKKADAVNMNGIKPVINYTFTIV